MRKSECEEESESEEESEEESGRVAMYELYREGIRESYIFFKIGCVIEYLGLSLYKILDYVWFSKQSNKRFSS